MLGGTLGAPGGATTPGLSRRQRTSSAGGLSVGGKLLSGAGAALLLVQLLA
jgi:hypothetical protein